MCYIYFMDKFNWVLAQRLHPHMHLDSIWKKEKFMSGETCLDVGAAKPPDVVKGITVPVVMEVLMIFETKAKEVR